MPPSEPLQSLPELRRMTKKELISHLKRALTTKEKLMILRILS